MAKRDLNQEGPAPPGAGPSSRPTVAVNDPAAYYRGPEPPSLSWELTICQSLADPAGPYAAALRERLPYGALLARFLASRLPWPPATVLELGGGYGTLMAAFLDRVPGCRATLVDVSPHFGALQRRALAGHPGCRFVEGDALAVLAGWREPADLVIVNEVVGDLPTVTGLDPRQLPETVAAKAARYGVDLSAAPAGFAFNLGAVELLERLAPVARAVFLSEHAADVAVPPPWHDLLVPTPGGGWPRRVALKGHDEYTIHFDHLAQVARALGYRVERFHLAELVGLRDDDGLKAMLRARTRATETAEMVVEFCDHLADYQGMVMRQ